MENTLPHSGAETDLRISLLLRTGVMLLESGADTSRVHRTLGRLIRLFGLEPAEPETDVSTDGMAICIRTGEGPVTQFRRCRRHGVDMAVLRALSNLSIDAMREGITPAEYGERLSRIGSAPRHYGHYAVTAGTGFACGGFCVQFGGDWTAFLIASLAAMAGFHLRALLLGRKANPHIAVCIAAFVSTLAAWAMGSLSLSAAPGSLFASATPWHPLMACALFIVPGVPLINFVSDMLENHVRTGIVRAVTTLLIVLAMSFGIALAIRVCGIDNFIRDLSMIPHHSYWEYGAAAAISAIGFSMIFNTPPRLLPLVAAGGVIAVCTRNLVSLADAGLGLGPVMGSFAGSALVSLLCVFVVRRIHAPHHCLSIPSVIPMIPGVLMYRALFALIEMHGIVGEVTVAVHNSITASLIILAIAAGVAVPNIFMRSLLGPAPESRR
ncbi:MAG: threonine/serine exporter family protein [Mailhella sp.]|nr:threonine/serine exporter family protein [Mailhella sp.]